MPNLRSPSFAVIDGGIRERILDFCESFARLTAHFIEVDARILQQARSPDEVQPREFVSTHYLLALSSITRRENLPRDDERIRSTERDEISTIMDHFLAYYPVVPCGMLEILDRLLQSMVALIPRVPRIVDHLGQICVITSFIVREASRKLANPSIRPSTVIVLNSRIARGHDMFNTASAALSTVIDNHITNLTYDNANQQIAALGDTIHVCLKAENADAIMAVEAFREANPDIPPEFIPDVYAMEWRFSMFCRLIMCSQMQLRVMAVTNLCQELVACWRRYGDHLPEAAREASTLQFISNLLATTGVVAYLLGPTCHPEITAESGNIIGFLGVTRTYTNEHTDMFWQTVTTTQDQRISEALLRMMCRITNLFSYDAVVYMCRKLLNLPISAYNQTMREFCDAILRHVSSKAALENPPLDTVPFAVCLHLLRESSVPGVRTPTAYPEMQGFAIEKLGELLKSVGIEPDQRQSLYKSCLSDIRDKSSTTLGSLCAINIINRHFGGRDLTFLTTENNLTELVVDDLENAIREGRQLGSTAVISGLTNATTPRYHLPDCRITPVHADSRAQCSPLGSNGGPRSRLQRRQKTPRGRFSNACAKRSRLESNPFLFRCFSEFLPTLPPDCFCKGLLDFVQDRLMPLVNDLGSLLLDEEDVNADHSILEQLWRIVLTAPPGTIERQAINMLVKDVYIESRSIMCFQHHRARKVHLALVNRCLKHLSSAARKLKAFANDGSSSGDDESMVVVPSESQIQEQEALFVRSLCVLKEFHRLYRTRTYFATPDLGSFSSESPRKIEGEPAQLKYQSFDGDNQTDVRPLIIGRRNTAGSLLASLKEVTGFENYRVFYRGQAFMPQESDICRPLEELRIHDGLILVKREEDPQTQPLQVRPGTSPVDAEILGHFKELWEYLSMEDKLAREIYHFLAVLPVEGSFLQKFENEAVSYKEIFPVGQPYQALYTVYGLREFLQMRRQAAKSSKIAAANASGEGQKDAVSEAVPERDDRGPEQAAGPSTETGKEKGENREGAEARAKAEKAMQAYRQALSTAKMLSIAAICDPDVTQCSAAMDLQISLSSMLIDILVFILNGRFEDGSSHGDLDETLLNRLMAILFMAVDAPCTEFSIRLVHLSTQAVMEFCAASRDFWEAFKKHESAGHIMERLILEDPQPKIRQFAARRVSDRLTDERALNAVQSTEFRDFFWPILQGLLPKAMQHPDRCEEVFHLALGLFRMMRDTNSPTLDMPSFVAQISDLVLSYTTFEVGLPACHPVCACLLILLSAGRDPARQRRRCCQWPSSDPGRHPPFVNQGGAPGMVSEVRSRVTDDQVLMLTSV